MFAVRQTGPGTVHLVGTAAGPLGGDVLEMHLRVHAGATLVLRSAAATIALPSRTGGFGRLDLLAVVEDGAHLDLGLEPLVVCHGAQVRALTVLELSGSATAVVTEQVVLGRYGEDGGLWRGRTVIERDGLPVLRHTRTSTIAMPPGSGHRALVSTVLVGSTLAASATAGPTAGTTGETTRWSAATSGGAVATPLATDALLITSTAHDLPRATLDHDAARHDADHPQGCTS